VLKEGSIFGICILHILIFLKAIALEMTTASKLGPHTHTHTHRAPKPRTSALLSCCWRRRHAQKNERMALVVNERISDLRSRPRPLPAAPLVVRRRYLISGVQIAARGAARCVPQVLDRGAQAAAWLCVAGT
jgi:hypothetical protein